MAKDWGALRKALVQHVRTPLLSNPDTAKAWESRTPTALGKELLDTGQIGASTTKETALWYALTYSCMHFDALTSLMQEDQFRPRALSALPEPSPRILHVDFGCGPGTASWAVINALPDDARITTIGHDHNEHMIELAKSMTASLDQTVPPRVTAMYHTNWKRIRRRVNSEAKHAWDAVFVTANALFGQRSVTDADVTELIGLINGIRTKAPNRTLFVFGTHPQYSTDAVHGAWQSIASEAGATVLFDSAISFESWSPSQYASDEASSWHRWNPPQLAHILGIPPRGGS